jgi:tripartite-type tricarboxylate transporter receptor subunit TctC
VARSARAPMPKAEIAGASKWSIVVPFAAGGPTDTVARTVAQAMEKALGGSVIVENKPGAGGTIGAQDVARAAPDGYRLLVWHIGMATAPALYRKLPFDPLKDFQHIGLINDVPMTLLVRPTLAVKDVKELTAYIGENKGKVTLANAGLGAASHLCGLLFQQAIKADLTTVPYKGTAPAITDLIGGQVDILCDQTTNTTEQIKGGKVKALALTAPKRLDTLKDLPTAAEAGVPGWEIESWVGLFAPAKTPAPVLDKLRQALNQVLANKDLRQRFETTAGEVFQLGATETDAFIKSESRKWGTILREAGIKPQ